MKQVKKVCAKVTEVAKRFVKEEEGIGVVEIILILVVLVGLVVVFKDEVGKVVDDAMKKFTRNAKSI